MQIQDLSHPKNSKALNESVAKQFGYKLNIDQYSIEQLREFRDTILSKLANFEVSKSYDAVYENRDYQKNRMFLDVITQAISERALSPGEEEKKEKYVKGMKSKESEFKKRYGKRGEEVMHATATKMAKTESIDEAMGILRNVLSEQVLTEGEEEKAALIMSSRDMVDKLTGWLEDVASLKAEALLELLDSIRDELGSDVSQSFADKVKPALEEVYNCLETNRQALAQAVSILTGEEAPGMGAEGAPVPPPAGEETLGAPEAELDAAVAAGPDEFGGSEAATGGEDLAGRAKRESVEYSRKLGVLLSSKKKLTENSNQLTQVLKTLQGRADSKGSPASFSWDAISRMMQNTTGQGVDYETFKIEFDQDPLLKNVVDRFDSKGVILKTKANTPLAPETGKDSSSLNSMAKKAAAKIMSR